MKKKFLLFVLFASSLFAQCDRHLTWLVNHEESGYPSNIIVYTLDADKKLEWAVVNHNSNYYFISHYGKEIDKPYDNALDARHAVENCAE